MWSEFTDEIHAFLEQAGAVFEEEEDKEARVLKEEAVRQGIAQSHMTYTRWGRCFDAKSV